MRGRLEQILDGDGETVRFANWDQDATAAEQLTGAPTPTSSARSSRRRSSAAATAFGSARRGRSRMARAAQQRVDVHGGRSARYFVHDILHHFWDVRG